MLSSITKDIRKMNGFMLYDLRAILNQWVYNRHLETCFHCNSSYGMIENFPKTNPHALLRTDFFREPLKKLNDEIEKTKNCLCCQNPGCGYPVSNFLFRNGHGDDESGKWTTWSNLSMPAFGRESKEYIPNWIPFNDLKEVRGTCAETIYNWKTDEFLGSS